MGRMGSAGTAWPFQWRVMVCVSALVVLGVVVFLLEFMFFFSSPVLRWTTARGTEDSTARLGGLVTSAHLDVVQEDQGRGRRLAVVVPAHAGDLNKALASLAKWPSTCHESTIVNTDLILYYAGGAEDDVGAALPLLSKTGGRCFAATRLILANLSEEDNVYPKGASVQFYQLFLDPSLRLQLSEYDVLAIIEWDVIVVHNTSFERLYAASFGGLEPFWVKGSTLEGTNFHETVVLPESRHVLGHINGNAIYNNTDPAFVDFVNFTYTRWGYTHSYDVALWATISDFPYSWPLWQRYSRKFVAIDLIANVGFLDVNNHAVMKAMASGTLFIHGSLTGGGGSMFHAAGAATKETPALLRGESNRPAERCKPSCGGGGALKKETLMALAQEEEEETPTTSSAAAAAAAAFGTSTVCDRSCDVGAERGARFGGHLCGAGEASRYGPHCRTCYTDLEEARAAEDRLAEEERVELAKRSSARRKERGSVGGKKNRILSNGSGGGGGHHRGMRWEETNERDGDRGDADEKRLLGGAGGAEKDNNSRGGGFRAAAAQGPDRGGSEDGDDDADDIDMLAERRRHVIMCDTLVPPPATSGCSLKCQKKDDTVCDRSCGTGRFGDYNCNWRGYGAFCRFCFNDREKALQANDVAKQRGGSVIMCHTFEPPTEKEYWTPPIMVGDEQLTLSGGGTEDDAVASAAEEDRESPPLKVVSTVSIMDEQYSDPANAPYTKSLKRGEICAFMTGFSFFIMETKVAVESVIHFMPGMRVAIATQAEEVSVFERTLGSLPGVRVSEATSPITLAPLLADRYCGEGTKLILYMNPGELLSRTFTSKDTHSTAGDLLVVYAEVDRIGETDLARALATMSVLGFSTPSFSFGTDILLPADSNRQLRDLLLSSADNAAGGGRQGDRDRDALAARALGKFPDVFVPEVLAALTYSRNPPGMWFVNPQQWVTRHMFEPASIWDIPLVKPRFKCAFDMSMAVKGYDMGAALDAQLGHFISGSSCELGFLHIQHTHLRPKPSIEFGPPTGLEMTTISEAKLRVSVVLYAVRGVSPVLLDASISSVAARFPEASEVVVVFTEIVAPSSRAGLLDVVKAHAQKAPFPVEAVEKVAPPLPPSGGWPGWSSFGVDDIASGEFVMQLEVGDILVEDVAYDNIFHFRKPVIPFSRLSVDGGGSLNSPDADSYADRYIACGIEAAIEMDAVRDFALLRGLVYPLVAYSEMKVFAGEVHNVEIDDLVEQAHKSCEGMLMADGVPVGPMVGRGVFEASLMGSFMWRYVPDVVHWRALDPLDIRPGEWLSDIGKYNLWCSMGHLRVPEDKAGIRKLRKALKGVNSRAACNSFVYDSR